MSEPKSNIPPSGDQSPKPVEAAKVQPKKETVRIALPPKPTSAPTIRLPALPTAGAAPAAPGAAAAAAPRPAAAAAVPTSQIPRPGQPPTSAPAATAARPGTSVSRPTVPAPAPDKAPASGAPRPSAPRTVGAFDTALAVIAALVGIAAVLSVLSLMYGPWLLN